MVSGSELAVLGTLAGATVSGVLSLLGVRFRQRAESDRRYGEAFLSKKADRIVELHDIIARCDNSISRLQHRNASSPLEFIHIQSEEVEDMIVEAFIRGDKATIYFEEEEFDTLQKGVYGLVSQYAKYSEEYEFESVKQEYRNITDEEEARSDIEDAKELLRKELNTPTDF